MPDPAQIVTLTVQVATFDPRPDALERTLKEAARCLYLTFGDAVTVNLEGHH